MAGTKTGLARYTNELVAALLARNDEQCTYVLLVRSETDMPPPPAPHRMLVADIPHYSLREQTVLPHLLRASGADIAFFPHFNAPFFLSLPFVVTVHDLILHRHPGNASMLKRAAYRILLSRALRRASAIIAVSRWTADDLAYTYGRAIERRVNVIGEGVHASYAPQSASVVEGIRMRYGIQRPFFLYVGNAKPHKNLSLLVRAFTEASIDTDLIIVSGDPDAQACASSPNVRVLSQVSDDDLPGMYSAARCFVTASLEEGYCLPVAEALACGCPVIATNRSAIPEILTGHGLLVEPTLETFVNAFRSPPTLAAPVIVGSWTRAAEETVALLQRVSQQ